MKTNKNFYPKTNAILIPTILFLVLSVFNHILFVSKAVHSFFWEIIPAFICGISFDFVIYLAVLWLVYLLNKKLLFLKKILIAILYFLSFLPILDFLYFNATLERFNLVVLNFINIHSAKGYISNFSLSTKLIFVFAALLLVYCIFISTKNVSTNKRLIRPITAALIFFGASVFFFHNTHIAIKNTFTGHLETVYGKNRVLSNLAAGSVSSFFIKTQFSNLPTEYKDYTPEEKSYSQN